MNLQLNNPSERCSSWISIAGYGKKHETHLKVTNVAAPNTHAACHLRKRKSPTISKKRGTERTHLAHEPHCHPTPPEYLDKDVYDSQGYYDNGKNGSAGNNNYYSGERNEEGAQEHEHSGRQSFIYDVDVLGEAVDDASYRCGVKERLGGVEFVGEQVSVQLLGCTDVPHG